MANESPFVADLKAATKSECCSSSEAEVYFYHFFRSTSELNKKKRKSLLKLDNGRPYCSETGSLAPTGQFYCGGFE